MAKRKIEIFSAGCPACNDTIELVKRISRPSCQVSVLDISDAMVASRAKSLGIRSVPAVVWRYLEQHSRITRVRMTNIQRSPRSKKMRHRDPPDSAVCRSSGSLAHISQCRSGLSH